MPATDFRSGFRQARGDYFANPLFKRSPIGMAPGP